MLGKLLGLESSTYCLSFNTFRSLVTLSSVYVRLAKACVLVLDGPYLADQSRLNPDSLAMTRLSLAHCT